MNAVPLSSVLLSLESGARPKGGASSDSGEIPSLGGEHIGTDGGFKLADVKRIPRPFFEAMRVGHIAPGDILVVKDGATTGKTSFVGDSFPFVEAAINEHVFRLRIDGHKAWPAYVFHYLYSPQGQSQIQLDFRGATVGGISRDFVSKVFLPFPSVSEQRRIAEVLDRAEALRAKRRAAVAKLDTLAQSIFHDMFGDPVSNPNGWLHKELGEVISVPLRNGKSPSRVGAVSAKVLTLSAVTGKEFDPTAWKTDTFDEKPRNNQSVDQLDLLICRGNGSIDRVGRGFFPPLRMADVTFPDTIIAARIAPNRVVPGFLQAIWNSNAVRRQVESLARTTNGTHKINQTTLEGIAFIAPPLQMQEEFAARAGAVGRLKVPHQASLAELDALFASLQQRAFSGRL